MKENEKEEKKGTRTQFFQSVAFFASKKKGTFVCFPPSSPGPGTKGKVFFGCGFEVN